MKSITRIENAFEEAYKSISLATWNRPRTNTELRSFLDSREAVVEFIEL